MKNSGQKAKEVKITATTPEEAMAQICAIHGVTEAQVMAPRGKRPVGQARMAIMVTLKNPPFSMPNADIADALGRTTGDVESYLSRARKKNFDVIKPAPKKAVQRRERIEGSRFRRTIEGLLADRPDLLERFYQKAARELRTPENHLLWLIQENTHDLRGDR